MSTNEMQSIISTLKRVLKGRKMNYQSLARALDMSESGVKKMLNGSDISLQRVLQICEAANVPFSEVVSTAQQRQPHTIRFNEEQEDFFLAHFAHYGFFIRLVEHGYSRDCVQEQTGLSDEATVAYLRTLAKLGLIELDYGTMQVADDFVREALKGQGVSVFPGKRLGAMIRRQGAQRLLERTEEVLVAGTDEWSGDAAKKVAAWHLQRKLTLTPASVEALCQSLSELLEAYSSRSAIEQTTTPPDALIDVGWLYALAPFDGAIDIPELPKGG